jgi:hypothetical protein
MPKTKKNSLNDISLKSSKMFCNFFLDTYEDKMDSEFN